MTSMIVLADISIWMTPLWLISLGATLGLVVLFAVYGLTWLAARRFAQDIPAILKEGVLLPIGYILLALAVFTLLGVWSTPYEGFLRSLGRLGAVGETNFDVTVPAGAEDFVIPLEFRGEELKSYEVTSTQDLLIKARQHDQETRFSIRLNAEEPQTWSRGVGEASPLLGPVTALLATNHSDVPARVTVEWVTAVEYPQVKAVPVTAAVVLSLFLIYFLTHLLLPKVSSIAAATAKQAIVQPLFMLAVALGIILLVTFIFIPYYTFGEDVKMLKDSGLILIMVLAIIVALWTASVSVAEEIEGRTALTLLSKPIGRRQFVLGKFLGIIWPTVLLFVILGLVFLWSVSYKVVYDAKEAAKETPSWQLCYLEVARTVPGLALSLMEAIVLASISVAISTRLPMLANLVICSSVYVLGHLVPLIVDSPAARFPIVRFVGMLIATILPGLDHYNIAPAVATGVEVPPVYLVWTFATCVLYSTIMMLLALAMFEDRDLA